MAVKRSGPGFATLNAKLKELEGVEAKTGWFESAHYETGQPVAYIAAIQELGDGKIPPRPFMRPTVAEKGKAWMNLLGQGAKAVLNSKATAPAVMEAVALQAAGDIAEKISEIHAPPLSLITLMLRKYKMKHGQGSVTGAIVGEMAAELKKGPPDLSGVSTKPLVETGQLIQSITGVVEVKK